MYKLTKISEILRFIGNKFYFGIELKSEIMKKKISVFYITSEIYFVYKLKIGLKCT